jgi:hypothetical protein
LAPGGGPNDTQKNGVPFRGTPNLGNRVKPCQAVFDHPALISIFTINKFQQEEILFLLNKLFLLFLRQQNN